MSYKPSRTFDAIEGDYSRDNAGPEALKADLDKVMKMFDPTATHSNGETGGIGTDNLNFNFADESMSASIGSEYIDGLTANNNVYAQLTAIVNVLLTHTNLTDADTLGYIGGKLNNVDSDGQSIIDSLYAMIVDRYSKSATESLIASNTNVAITSLSYDESSGKLTATTKGGTTTEVFDLNVEMIPVEIGFMEEDNTTYIYIRSEGESGTRITKSNITNFVTQYSFTDSADIDFTVTDGVGRNKSVTATIKDGAVTTAKLDATIFSTMEGYATTASNGASSASTSASNASTSEGNARQSAISASGSASSASASAGSATNSASSASSSATTASQKATLAESYAKSAESYAVGGTGTRSGENTDNAKYYKEQAESVANNTANALRSEIATTVSSAKSEINATASSAIADAKSEVEGIANTAKSSIESTASTAETNINNAVSSAETNINNAVSTAETAISGVADGVEQTLNEYSDSADSIKSSIESTASTAETNINNAVSTAKTNINNAVSTGKSDINSSISNAKTTLQSYVTSSATNAANAKSSADRAESIASSVSSFTTIVCDELPATGSNGVMYFVPNTNTEGQNIYDEYMWVASTSKFELVGNTGINLDLSKDWNENDSTSDKYIENRTHWKEALSEDVLCFEISSDDGDWFADTVNDNLCFRHRIASSYAINIGNTVIVTINGVDKYVTVIEDYNAPAIGKYDEFDDYYIYYYYGEYGIYAYVSSYDTPPSISVKIPAYVNNAEIPSEAFTETSSGPYGSEGYLNNVQFSSYLKLNDTVIVTINDVDYTYTTTEYGQYVMIDDLDINGIYIQSSAYQSVVFVIKSKFSDPPSVSIKTPTIIYHTLNTRYLPSDVVTTDFLYDYVDWESVDDEYDSTSTDPISGVGVADAISKLSASDVGLGNVGNFKAVSTLASQGLTDTEKNNARANIGAGTSSLTLGTTATTAAKGNHTHSSYVPKTRKINNKELSADITLTASDVGATAKSDFTTEDGKIKSLTMDNTEYAFASGESDVFIVTITSNTSSSNSTPSFTMDKTVSEVIEAVESGKQVIGIVTYSSQYSSGVNYHTDVLTLTSFDTIEDEDENFKSVCFTSVSLNFSLRTYLHIGFIESKTGTTSSYTQGYQDIETWTFTLDDGTTVTKKIVVEVF